jgi:pimeloyl-ACP methyl ester carboxylesterase
MARVGLPNPVIVIPGITATYLADQYPLPPEAIWTVLTKDYERASLHPDDTRFEALEPARVVPGQVYEIAYRELIEELRFNLRQREDRPVPVFPFGYDWRQPLEAVEAQLAAFIDEVIERTSLIRHYAASGYRDDPAVDLVGHSMGGLLIAGYLASAKKPRVGKVATLATPFQGSFEAVIKVATGTADLGVSPPSSREREAARITPALYHLIPSFANGLTVDDPDLPRSLFDAGLWQPSVVDTIAEYVRVHGVSAADRLEQARALFAQFLKAARDYRRKTDALDLKKAGLAPGDWLCVVGVDSVTRVRLRVVRRGRNPDFALSSTDRTNQWRDTSGDPTVRRMTGDGTVPFEGAIPRFLQLANLVCVTPDDFGYWEIQDRVTASAAGFHGILPNMDMLHRLIVRHFTGAPDRRGNTWGRPAPGISADAWSPAVPDLRVKE